MGKGIEVVSNVLTNSADRSSAVNRICMSSGDEKKAGEDMQIFPWR